MTLLCIQATVQKTLHFLKIANEKELQEYIANCLQYEIGH